MGFITISLAGTGYREMTMKNNITSVIRAGCRLMFGVLLCTIAIPVWAVKSVNVEGLFKDKAVLMIDSKRRIVRVGDESPEGVKLVSIKGEEVVLIIDEERRTFRLGEHASFRTSYASPQHPEVIIQRDDRGMYSTSGSINNSSVSFLVDTGASVVTLNAGHARRLGIDAKKEGQPTIVNTASSVEKAYHVMLNKVTVGGIVLHNIGAVVMSGAHPENILLGMTFLGKLELQHAGSVMKLKKKW